MKKEQAVNTFSDGLIMDLHPLSMPETALSNALNATYLTYNGNENMLQNDMGNARVETAMLPTGYIPLGSTSFGGIIYIISYNPIEKKCQIGSFPSPERNLSKDELDDDSNAIINLDAFCDGNWSNYTKSDDGTYKLENGNYIKIEEKDYKGDRYKQNFGSPDNIITNYYQKVNLCKEKVYAGDKYKVFSDNISDNYGYISAWDKHNQPACDVNAYPKYLKFEIVSTLDDGKTIELTNDSVWTTNTQDGGKQQPPYYVYNGSMQLKDEKIDIDEYRGLVGSNYDTYVSKLSGKLGVVAKLEVPTSFSVGYKAIKENGQVGFYFLINWSNDSKEYKSRVNPNGVNIKFEQNSTINEFNNNSITLDNNIPDSINNINYPALITRDENYKTQLLQNNFDENNYRKNDGTDPYYVLKNKDKPFYINRTEGIETITLTPTMPFGQLKFLKKELKVNLGKLNSGELNLFNYKYYVYNDIVRFSFYTEGYPKDDDFTNLQINAIKLSDIINNENKDILLNSSLYSDIGCYDDLFTSDKTPIEIHSDIGLLLSNYELEIDISYLLNKNEIYLLQFKIKEGDNFRYFYRLFFNCNIFNKFYDQVSDFRDIELGDAINLSLEYSKNLENISKSEINSDIDKIKNEESVETKVISHDIEIEQDGILNVINDQLDTLTKFELNNINNVKLNKQFDSDFISQTNNQNYVISNNNITFQDQFQIDTKYEIYYNNLKIIPKYELQPLKSNNLSKIYRLQHDSSDEDDGSFSLWSRNITDEPWKQLWSYPVFDKSKGEVILISSGIEQVLEHEFNSDLDYLDISFGIFKIDGGNRKAYTFMRENEDPKVNFYNFNGVSNDSIEGRLINVNCFRFNGGVAVVHTRLDSKGIFDQGTDEDKHLMTIDSENFEGTKNDYNKAVPKYDYGLIKNDDYYGLSENNGLIRKGINDVKRYQKQNESFNAYSISNINYDSNITADIIYNLNFNANCNFTINEIKIAQDKNITPNLKIFNKSFEIQQKVNVKINNAEFINNLLTIDDCVGVTSKNEYLQTDDLNKVYDSNKNECKYFTIDNQGKVNINLNLSEDLNEDSQFSPIKWGFYWELVGNGNVDNPDDFHQNYRVYYTYELGNKI